MLIAVFAQPFAEGARLHRLSEGSTDCLSRFVGLPLLFRLLRFLSAVIGAGAGAVGCGVIHTAVRVCGCGLPVHWAEGKRRSEQQQESEVLHNLNPPSL